MSEKIPHKTHSNFFGQDLIVDRFLKVINLERMVFTEGKCVYNYLLELCQGRKLSFLFSILRSK